METQQKQNTKENQNKIKQMKQNTGKLKKTKNKKQNGQPKKAQVRSGRNTAEEGGDGRMTRWGRVEDLP